MVAHVPRLDPGVPITAELKLNLFSKTTNHKKLTAEQRLQLAGPREEAGFLGVQGLSASPDVLGPEVLRMQISSSGFPTPCCCPFRKGGWQEGSGRVQPSQRDTDLMHKDCWRHRHGEMEVDHELVHLSTAVSSTPAMEHPKRWSHAC